MARDSLVSRRGFLRVGLTAGAAAALAGCAGKLDSTSPRIAAGPAAAAAAAADQPRRPLPESEQAAILPSEDLMREHGLLARMLLILEAASATILVEDVETALAKNGQPNAQSPMPNPLSAIRDTVRLVRTVVQDYHEKLEEQFVFPIVKRAGLTGDLPDILLAQHNAGRKLIETIEASAARQPIDAETIQRTVARFVRMYRPHKAREDTVLFPAFRSLYTAKQFADLGDKFEAMETKQLGEQGFEKAVLRVAEIEKSLGIESLAKFTPRE
jgi:hemerythrin-like domain-containing protein